MSRLRKADKHRIVRFAMDPDPEDGSVDFLEVRAELTKAEVNHILRNAPTPKFDADGKAIPDMDQGIAFIELFFDVVVMRWSATDEDGNPIEPTLANYHELGSEGGQWIEKSLGEHLNALIGKKVEDDEGKPETSPDS